jgi:hypothetical protein
MANAVQDLELTHLWVVYPGDRAYLLTPKVSVLPITQIGAGWAYE